MSARRDWPTLLDLARQHVADERATVGAPPSLRRLHYLLVSDPRATAAGYANTEPAYKALSNATARAREAGTFPALLDHTRRVFDPWCHASLAEALTDLADTFRLDRREAMSQRLVIVSEKAGLVPLLRTRFAWLDVTALGGYSSLTHADTLAARYDAAVYVGDYDPSGLDIERDARARTGLDVHRVALTLAQVETYQLPPAPAKPKDSRTARMAAEHGHAVQVEVDALPSPVLLDAVAEAVSDLSGLDLDAHGWPDLTDLDDAEESARETLRQLAEEAS